MKEMADEAGQVSQTFACMHTHTDTHTHRVDLPDICVSSLIMNVHLLNTQVMSPKVINVFTL